MWVSISNSFFYAKLSKFHSNGELITPHQVILLTFLDTHLHSEPATDSKDFMFILPVVAAAVERARDAIQQALRLNKSDSDDKPLSSALDVELVPPLSALVPAARCSMRLSLDEIDGDSVSPIYSQGLKAVPSLIENIVGRYLLHGVQLRGSRLTREPLYQSCWDCWIDSCLEFSGERLSRRLINRLRRAQRASQ